MQGAEDGGLVDAGRGETGGSLRHAVPLAWLDLRHEDVASAANRLDDLWSLGVCLELLAQAPNLDVDGTVEGPRLAPSGLLEKEVA